MSKTAECRNTPEVNDCPFCGISNGPRSSFDLSTPIDEHGDVLLRPDLGMLMPGHLLAITEGHLTSFAQLGSERLRVVDELLNSYETTLAQQFGKYFRIEHGSDNIKMRGSGACIDHAHTHLVPADEDVGPYIQDQLPWQELDSYEDLSEFKGSPYVYLGRLAMHYVIPDPRLNGQWVRRQVAAVRGLEHWDWALFDSSNEIHATFDGIKALSLQLFQEAGE